MALFYLVRHGEANYEYMFENGFCREKSTDGNRLAICEKE